MDTELPYWRSLLFVPANRDRFIDGAVKRGADAYVLDLEDSVPAAEKSSTRDGLQDAVRRLSGSGVDVLVRINRPWRLAIRDIEASVAHGVTALALPKVPDPGYVCAVAEILEELEAERGLESGHTRLIVMIETPQAYFQAREIASAHARVVAMTLGQEDFALETGMLPESEGLFAPTLQTMLAARAAGILPLGFVGSIAEYRDEEKFRATIRQARRLGFVGSFCIHPIQVRVLNEEMTPTAEELTRARTIVAAYDEARAKGQGSVEFEGKMLDEPIVRRSAQLLMLAERLHRV
ncbi:MAG TPA: CoA ester lyase [Gammaproteobacteria bacterium]|nr:CoA ester lyase [Gammaproteobacteria bacterium]HBK76249.1 CoA ester lyase [Gammaproteobacteria bacterium]HIM88573.1 CoA ester lyase [Gammaproteobacteria bacterium]HIM98149.1 CoA ester lyase [Gammaproteobacteria bacterium]